MAKDDRYVITGSMADGSPYSAEGMMQPDGSVLFQIPHQASIKDSIIDEPYRPSGERPKQYIIEKAAA